MNDPALVREIPPPSEMLCLNALWSLGQGSVRDVRKAISTKKKLAYTTVMTVLDRMAKKELLSRRKVGRAFVYAPAISREAMQRMATSEFIDCFFEGSAGQLMAFLGGSEPRALPAAAPIEGASLDPVLL